MLVLKFAAGAIAATIDDAPNKANGLTNGKLGNIGTYRGDNATDFVAWNLRKDKINKINKIKNV